MSERVLTLLEDWEGHEDSLPQIYLAAPLSHLDNDDRQAVEFLADAICEAVIDATTRAAKPWKVGLHSPVRWTPPWKADGQTPEQIYRLNSNEMWSKTDALIVIGFRGASLGAGQELGFAMGLAMPVLYVHPKDQPVSRQLSGALDVADLTIVGYESPQHLRDRVRRWVGGRRHLLGDGPRRRRGRRLRFASIQTQIREAWEQCDSEERDHVVAVTRIARGRIERLASDPYAVAAATCNELFALVGALQLESVELPHRVEPPRLGSQQVEAMLNAASEYEWPPGETLRVYDLAARELAGGGVRRLPLSSIEDWVEFRRACDE